MSRVFTCGCGRKTTDPFIVDGRQVCVICAEFEQPEVVTSRERTNWKRYQEETGYRVRYKERYGIH